MPDEFPERPERLPRRTVADLMSLLGLAGTPGDTTRIQGVVLDSRRVRPGDLYAALPGARAHGADFAAQAAARGAVVALTDAAGCERVREAGLAAVVIEDPRSRLGEIARWVYGDPAADLVMLGVTGTNGKTTTCYLIEAALRHAGWRTGLIGTVETRVGERGVASARTTPEAPDLHALLGVMREESVRACAMEVSSHALALHRVDGVVFDVAGFTNLSQDHLDFHRDLEDYFAVKASLLTPQRARAGVVCVDDRWGERAVAHALAAGLPVCTVATREGVQADWVVGDLRPAADRSGTVFTMSGPGGERADLTSPLPGRFNVANTALAAVIVVLAGLTLEQAADGLASAKGIPGRMEVVRPQSPGDPRPLGVVDYSHTPQAIELALDALREYTPGRLVVVLGAGGDRDPGKRSAMGAAAAQGADVVVVTDDNPRTEDPARIRAAVRAGADRVAAAAPRGQVVVVEEPDRRIAVEAAVRYAVEAGPGGTVLVAGKGHESGQEVAGTVFPFDDREVLADALQ